MIYNSVILFNMQKNTQKPSSHIKNDISQMKKYLLKSSNQINLELFPNQLQNYQDKNKSLNPEKITTKVTYSLPQNSPPQNVNHSNAIMNKNDSSSKRLKLKEYLHLNSIQKKSKSRPSNSFSKLQSQQQSFTLQNSVKLTQRTSQNASRVIQPPNKLRRIQDVKQEIQRKIEQQINKLQQISLYIETEYKNRQQQKQSEVFLCSLCSTLQKESRINNSIGQSIVDYEQIDPSTVNSSPASKKYFWLRDKIVLQSPAKILKQGLEFTCSSFQFVKNEAKTNH